MGNYPASSELSGAVAQSQGTVHAAVERIGHRYQQRTADGFDVPGDYLYMVRPRSFVLAGDLSQFRDIGGGMNDRMVTSFELFRRNTFEPEIITFDELLERAKWITQASS